MGNVGGREHWAGDVSVNVGIYLFNVGHESRFTSSFLRMPDSKCNMIMLEFLNLFLWVTLETGADVCGALKSPLKEINERIDR